MDELFGSQREIKIPGMSLTVWIDLFQEGHGFPIVLTARSSSQVGATDRVGGCNRSQEIGSGHIAKVVVAPQYLDREPKLFRSGRRQPVISLGDPHGTR